MKLEQYQKICLKDGRIGHITEIFNDGEAYLLDILMNDGEYEQETITPADIASIVVEIKQPFVTA